MSRTELLDYDLWEQVAKIIHTDRDYHYDTSDMSHCIDLVQIVCTALARLHQATMEETP